MKKIAVLTSSRADYSIYLPLLKEFKSKKINFDIIVFGTHTSYFYGETIKNIYNDGFKVKHIVENLLLTSSPESISDSMGLTFIKFSKIWSSENYCNIVTLGDRYEMFAAAYSSIPFNIPITHISGGEKTIGAIDNCFRDALTVISKFHFSSTNQYAKRVKQIKGSNNFIYNVGALNIDTISQTVLLSKNQFYDKYKIDLNKSSILVTFHPETVSYEQNEKYINELTNALEELNNFQIIITMPNADTMGSLIRKKLLELSYKKPNCFIIESFGTTGYLSCMKHSTMMLGNTSSGFVEASYFNKPVINIGNRQTGRLITNNIINCEIEKKKILKNIDQIINKKRVFKRVGNVYGTGKAASKIVKILIKEIDKKL